MSSTIFLCFVLLAPRALPAALPDPAPGQQALRDGRFDEAASRFDDLARGHPDAPEGPFFQAFHLWWRLLDDPPASDALRADMEARLALAVQRADLLAGGESEEDRLRGLLFRGVALLLEAQSKAGRGAHFAAASSARQGHKALSEALALRPGMPDALFAMGTYDYYADNLPLLVKGLRFFLFIPGGDKRRGIARLEAAASGSRLFGTEALVLLAHIFSGAWEHDLSRAIGYIDRAAARHPRSPMIALARSRILRDAGRLREALDAARSALEMASDPAIPRELIRMARYRRAEIMLELHAPASALALVEEALREDPPRGEAENRRWLRLLSDASREAGRPGVLAQYLPRFPIPGDDRDTLIRKAEAAARDEVAAPRADALARLAGGDARGARSLLEDLIARYPGDPRLRYDLGRLLQIQDDPGRARAHLEAAARSDATEAAGWAKIRIGWDLERSGRRDLALPYYRDAASMRRFAFREAARERLMHPSTDQPEG